MMTTIRLALLTFGMFLALVAVASAKAPACRPCHRLPPAKCGEAARGWRDYTAEERRNFPRCYGGYERYYGGFHVNYFRDVCPSEGITNDRYGYGAGWAW